MQQGRTLVIQDARLDFEWMVWIGHKQVTAQHFAMSCNRTGDDPLNGDRRCGQLTVDERQLAGCEVGTCCGTCTKYQQSLHDAVPAGKPCGGKEGHSGSKPCFRLHKRQTRFAGNDAYAQEQGNAHHGIQLYLPVCPHRVERIRGVPIMVYH